MNSINNRNDNGLFTCDVNGTLLLLENDHLRVEGEGAPVQTRPGVSSVFSALRHVLPALCCCASLCLCLFTMFDNFIKYLHTKHKCVIYLNLQERGASVVESVVISYKNPECGGTVVLGSQDQETWSNPLLDTKGES